MDRLPLNALRAFALVLERGGVRAAARELEISHSAVSRHLKELERWLGVTLLEQRDSGGLRASAQRLARHAAGGRSRARAALFVLRERVHHALVCGALAAAAPAGTTALLPAARGIG